MLSANSHRSQKPVYFLQHRDGHSARNIDNYHPITDRQCGTASVQQLKSITTTQSGNKGSEPRILKNVFRKSLQNFVAHHDRQRIDSTSVLRKSIQRIHHCPRGSIILIAARIFLLNVSNLKQSHRRLCCMFLIYPSPRFQTGGS